MKKAALVCTILLAGCQSQDDKIIGTWEAESCPANGYCSFTIEKKISGAGDWRVTITKDDIGPLKHVEGEYYELFINGENTPLRFKDGKFYNFMGTEFKRVKEAKLDD